MRQPWPTSGWIALLALASQLLATLVSVAVVGWLPRPAAPQMRIDQAAQVLRGEIAAAPAGLRLQEQSVPPAGNGNHWLSLVAAQQLGLPISRVRLVWSSSAQVPDVHIVANYVLPGAGKVGKPPVVEDQLAALHLPPFELGVHRGDSRWQVVGIDHSDLAIWRRQALLAFLAGTMLLAPLAAWAAYRLGRPLRRLADASAEFDLRSMKPLPIDGPREVRMLAEAINTSRARLREQAEDLTRLLAAAAHDLRTPLTGLRIRAVLAPPEPAKRMVADIERMNAMIQQVLDYSRGQLDPPSIQHLDIVSLVDDCAHAAGLRGVKVQANLPDSLPWEADTLLLRRALDNLIDNAGRYAGSVELRIHRLDDVLLLEVADRGPGIPAEDRVRLLQPFQRGEESRSCTTGGAGLGLAIVANAARRHGGELLLLDREGGGLVARMVLRRMQCRDR